MIWFVCDSIKQCVFVVIFRFYFVYFNLKSININEFIVCIWDVENQIGVNQLKKKKSKKNSKRKTPKLKIENVCHRKSVHIQTSRNCFFRLFRMRSYAVSFMLVRYLLVAAP